MDVGCDEVGFRREFGGDGGLDGQCVQTWIAERVCLRVHKDTSW